jgi:hypothetical protein
MPDLQYCLHMPHSPTFCIQFATPRHLPRKSLVNRQDECRSVLRKLTLGTNNAGILGHLHWINTLRKSRCKSCIIRHHQARRGWPHEELRPGSFWLWSAHSSRVPRLYGYADVADCNGLRSRGKRKIHRRLCIVRSTHSGGHLPQSLTIGNSPCFSSA